MNLKISYNPYQMESEFSIDGERVPDETQWVEYMVHRRLQGWFFPSSDWKGLGDELSNQLNEASVNITFEGREVDYQDLKAYFDEYETTGERTTHFRVIPPEVFGKGDQSLKQELNDLVQNLEDSPVPEMHVPEIRAAYENAIDSEFDMAVIATMSSGKSTLINALLGKDLLPARNAATTAKITRISDRDGAEDFEVSCYNIEEEQITKQQPATPELLEEYNNQPDVFYVDMTGDIPGISNEALRLRILDTPGPNNSATKVHREIMNSVIRDQKRSPMILYVMDSTKPEDDSDAYLLENIAQEIAKFGKEAQDRFIFVMNKADELDKDKDGSVLEIVKKRQEYLARLGIQSNQIIPVSAQAAKLLRMKQRGEPLSKHDEMKLSWMLQDAHLDEASILTSTCRAQLEEKRRNAEKNGDETELNLIATGIIGLELTINEYLSKYAYPYKINRAVTNFKRVLQDSSMMTTLADTLANDAKALQQAKEELSKAEKRQKELAESRTKLKNSTVDIKWEESDMDDIRRKLEREIARMQENLKSDADKNGQIPISEKKRFFRELNRARTELFRDFEKDALSDIEEQIKNDFTPLYKQYAAALTEAQTSFQIKGYDPQQSEDFCKLRESLSDMQVTDIEYDQKFLGARTERETHYKENPARSGFFGFFKFWEPSMVSYEENVTYHDVIDVKKVLLDAAETTRDELKKILDKLSKASTELYEARKADGLLLVEQYDKVVKSEMKRLTELTETVGNRQIDLKNNEEKKNWLDNCMQTLDGILSLNEKRGRNE